MKSVPSSPAPPPKAPPPGPVVAKTTAPLLEKTGLLSFAFLFEDIGVTGKAQASAEEYIDRQKKLVRLIQIQNYIVSVLLILIILLAPALQPIYEYTAMKPNGDKRSMASLTVPNLTDQTILSWSASTITDVLTFGFGDMDRRILSQKKKFTKEGWISFLKGFIENRVDKSFKENQLVLTAVPTDQPVIVFQGLDIDATYKWVVEMPVVMNYTTNNLVSSSSKGVVRLILVRVSTHQNPDGLGIETWTMQ